MSYENMPSGRKTNICFDCKNACGRCPWSRYDPEKKRTAFEPVPGWTAEKVPFLSKGERNKRGHDFTYHITACPLFERG